MKFNKVTCFLLIAALSCLVSGSCTTTPQSTYSETYSWTMAVSSSSHVTREATQELLSSIEEKTDGVLTIEETILPSSFFPERLMLSYISTGIVDIAAPGCDMEEACWMRFHTYPYFLETPDIDTYRAFAEAQFPMVQETFEECAVKAINPQGMPSYLSRLLLATKKPVNTVEDISGKVINVSEPQQFQLLHALGAEPSSLQTADAFIGLWNDAIDGILIKPESAISFSIDEVAGYSVGLWPVMTLSYYGVEQAAFESLPEDLQAILLECFDEYSNESWASVIPSEGENRWAEKVSGSEHSYLTSLHPEEEAKLIQIARSCWIYDIERAGSKGQEWLDIYETVTGYDIGY